MEKTVKLESEFDVGDIVWTKGTSSRVKKAKVERVEFEITYTEESESVNVIYKISDQSRHPESRIYGSKVGCLENWTKVQDAT